MNIAKMMQQAKQMQAKMEEMQEKLADVEVTGEPGAGLVKATVNGKGIVKALKISPEVAGGDDIEMMEDLIIAAINDAKQKADDKVQDETARMMEEMGLPAGMMGGGGLPF